MQSSGSFNNRSFDVPQLYKERQVFQTFSFGFNATTRRTNRRPLSPLRSECAERFRLYHRKGQRTQADIAPDSFCLNTVAAFNSIILLIIFNMIVMHVIIDFNICFRNLFYLVNNNLTMYLIQ